MRCSLNGITIINSDLENDLKIAHETGFEGIEIWRQLFKPKLEDFLYRKSANDLADLLSIFNLEPVSICPFLNMFFSPENERKKNIKIFKEMLSVADRIECSLFIVCPEEIHGVESDKIKNRALQILQLLGDLAEDYKIKIGFEFRGIESEFAPNLYSTNELINELNHDSVGLVVDTPHFFKSKSSFEDLESVNIEKLLLIQVEDFKPLPMNRLNVDDDRVYPGEGTIPLREILQIVKNKGYHGFISFETFATYWKEDPFVVASRAYESFNALLKSLR